MGNENPPGKDNTAKKATGEGFVLKASTGRHHKKIEYKDLLEDQPDD